MIRSVPLVAVLWFVLSVGSANAWQQGERAAARHCDQNHPISCIHRASLHYRIDYSQAKRIAFRESRFRWWPCNPQPVSDGEHACGLYQFIPSTWSSTPYGKRGESLYRAKWAALGYAWFIHHGGSGNWGF